LQSDNTRYPTNCRQTRPASRHRFACYGTRHEQTAPHAMCQLTFYGGASFCTNQGPHGVCFRDASQCCQDSQNCNFSTSFSFNGCVTIERKSSVHDACSRPLCMLSELRWNWQYAVTTTDLMFKKIFELWWFEKLHVEMDLMWFW